MNSLSAVAQSIVESLNGASFSVAFTATRSFKPAFDLQDLAELHVTVVPQSITPTAAIRDARQNDIVIDIGVQERVNPDDLDAMDALLELVAEIDQHLRRKPMAAAGDSQAAWLKSETQLVHAHLAQHRTFTAVIRLTYRTIN